MEYQVALDKAWQELASLTEEKRFSIHFLGDMYDVDLEKKSILSESCNIPAKTYLSILMLHYLIKKTKGLPPVAGEWISFKELVGGEGYYPVFKKRVIETIKRKHEEDPESLLELVERFRAKKAQVADVSVALETFESVPFLITFWKGDDEFGPELNVLYDKSITDISCTEDIVVLSEIVAHTI